MNVTDGFDCAQCRELDRVTIEEFGIPGILLMEHASLGTAMFTCERLRRLRSQGVQGARVWILCGGGNNGGDGYAIARHLQNAGVEVEVWALTVAATDNPPPESDSSRNRAIAQAIGIPLTSATPDLPENDPAGIDVIVDAIFGTGLTRPPQGRYAAAIARINAHKAPVVCVDVPSGLDADSGEPLVVGVHGTWTVTFGLPKRGFFHRHAGRFTGDVYCVPIGIPRHLLPDGVPAFPPTPEKMLATKPRPEDDR